MVTKLFEGHLSLSYLHACVQEEFADPGEEGSLGGQYGTFDDDQAINQPRSDSDSQQMRKRGPGSGEDSANVQTQEV